MKKYIPTIGLEIHAELKTKTKMFCDSANDPDADKPNTNICPVCMAHPGTLPTINKEAVRHILKVGHAVGGTIADFTEFDRKNYFYPDIPKGYQISQYDYPLVSGGLLHGVELTRIHLEEDTARSTHDKGNYSLVDFNRAGLPLMELVTEPVIKSGEEAAMFAKELQLLLRYLGAGEANMEKGQMRVEANISVSSDPNTFGTKVEVKNLNSFRSVQNAIAYEIERHTEVYENGEELVQETRGWDEVKGETFSQRQKEEANDYRYFPEPDLPALWISKIPEFSEQEITKDMPELPWERRKRYQEVYGFEDQTADIFINSLPWAAYFEEVTAEIGEDKEKQKLAVNYITSDLMGLVKNDPDTTLESSDPRERIDSAGFVKIISMVESNELSSRGAKDLLAILYKEGGDPDKIAKDRGLIQTSDTSELQRIVDEIIAENPDESEKYRNGNENVAKFLIGQGMKKSKGSANPQVLANLLKQTLSK